MAGSRDGADPLASATGVAHKALAPVEGIPMLDRVLATLRASRWIGRVVVCGLDPALAAHGGGGAAVEIVRGERTPSASAALAIEQLGLAPPVLITTADHPLLSTATLDAFCERAIAINADATFGLVPIGLVHAAFPGIRRTAFRFRDGGFCGCNLYGLLTKKGYAALREWTRVEGERKRPWRMLRILGYGTLLRFALGRLSLADLTGAVFARTGLSVRPVLLTDPAAGFDIDTPEQRLAAEAFLRSKAG
ncbi:MAG: nucleotidyltransferase family protein [Deltaproteobacteria bacterium]|nr:nucleotidyltransferase family protein [Deltaproteobacteria bacterium]